MSRPWRIEYPGAVYHLTSRGNKGGSIFRDNEDRSVFLAAVGEFSERFETDVFAYVLMDNHYYHLLVRTRDANLKKVIHWFGTTYTYTQGFNRRHDRSGYLFQGRYKSIIVENNAYMMRLSCYIHRNPLQIGIVDRLAEYRWSSYLAYAYGGRSAPLWLSTNLILSQFDKRVSHAYSDEAGQCPTSITAKWVKAARKRKVAFWRTCAMDFV